jgi:hypothetical protein
VIGDARLASHPRPAASSRARAAKGGLGMTTTRSDIHSNAAAPSSPPFTCGAADMGFFATAAERYVTEVDLDVDPARLFAVFDDEASWPRWAKPGITHVAWTSPRPHGVGTTRTVRMLGGLEVYEHFFAWSPGREMAFHFTGTSQKVWDRFAERYEVTPLGEGKCRLKWTVAYEPAGGFGRVHFLVRPIMVRVFRRYLRNLAKYVRDAA